MRQRIRFLNFVDYVSKFPSVNKFGLKLVGRSALLG